MECSYWKQEIELWIKLSWEDEAQILPVPKPLLAHAEKCQSCSVRLKAAMQMVGGETFSNDSYNAGLTSDSTSRIVEHVMKQISLSDAQYTPDSSDLLSGKEHIQQKGNKKNWWKGISVAAAAVILFLAGSLLTLYFGPNGSEDYIVVQLVVTIPHAQQVSVAGDWNSWDPSKHQMQKINSNDTWEIEFTVASDGEYRYQLVIDGEEWIPDPGAGLQIEDGFGSMNSILEM